MDQEATTTETPAKMDLDGITIRCAKSITERILTLAYKHETQSWRDAPGTDAEKLARIVGEARDLLELLDSARAKVEA